MKRLLTSAALFLCLLLTFAQFSGSGSGTENDSYLIMNPILLNQLRNNLNQSGVCFRLMADIDLAEFFTDGMVSGSQHGDYNAPFSRDISKDEGYWYKIYTEFEDNIPAPTLIKVKVEKFGGKYMITDVKLN